MDKKKILSSLALAGILTANVFGANVNAAAEGEYLKPVGVYKKLVEGKTVVPYVLKDKNTPVTVKDVQAEFTNLESVNGIKVTDMNATMGTGDTFQLQGEEEDYTVVVYGDVTGEGKISTKDALLIQKIALKKETNVSKEILEAADVNHNGKVSTKDALAVQKYVLGKGEYETVIDKLPPVEDTTAPVINGVTDGQKIYVKLNNEEFTLPVVTATDDYDGEVTVTRTGEVNLAEEGEYNIIYTATDKAGNIATATIKVIVDGTNPILKGVTDGQKIMINLGDENFELPEVTATDNNDEEVAVTKTGEVNLAEEGEYNIVYTATDKAGNTATVTLTVVVDDQAPVINGVTDGQKIYVKLNNEEFTLPEVTAIDAVDGEVAVTIEGEDDIDLTTEGEYEISYSAKDSLNHETTVTVTVVVDGTAPEANVNYSTTMLTKENVIVTIISNELIQAPEGWELCEGGKSIQKPYTENVQDEKLMVSDLAGNETETHIKISNIDNKVTANPSYSTTQPTNGSVVATITSDEVLQEVEGWTLASNKMSMTKEYTANKIEDVIVKDGLGNETTVTIDIRNIDKQAPTAKVEYDITELTKGDVMVTIIANENLQAVRGTINTWELEEEDQARATATFTSNGTETVTITDLAGNETEIPVKVDNIDKTAPELEVSYNIEVATNQNVIATITANEPMQEKEGWTLAEDALSMTKEYDKNISEEVVEINDLAGNAAKITVTITNIDKVAPVVTGLTEGKKSYKQVTLQFTEGVATLQKEGEAEQDYITNTPVTVDGNYVLVVKDAAGNTTTKNFTIDNVAPVFDTMEAKLLKKGDNLDTTVVAKDAVDGDITADLEITYNGDVVESIDTTGKNDGEYTLTYTATDEAGNTATATRTITVDATPAVATIMYGTQEATTEVIVRVSFKEEMQLQEGWEVEDDATRLAFTKKYTENKTEIVEFKDKAGNVTPVKIEIKNIDSEEPSTSTTYNTKEPTNQPVEVTITVNKEIQAVAGWTPSADNKSITKVFTENTITPEIVTIKDLVGHETTVEVEVTNIDKVAPVGTARYSKTTPTKENIIVTIEAGEKLQPLAGWKLAEDGLSMEKTYTENKTENVTIKDLAGNEADVAVSIANIDREAPVVKGDYQEGVLSYQELTLQFEDANDVEATLQKGAEEPTEYIEGTTITVEGSYKLVVTDSLGNTTTILFNIDKTDPMISGVVEGGRYKIAKPTFTKGVGRLSKLDTANGNAVISTTIYALGDPITITEDGTYRLVVTDAAGNEASVTFTVDNEGPTITGVEDKGLYNQAKTPDATTNGTIESVDLTKDGVKVEGYALRNVISEEGVYVLTVTDDLGNKAKVTFTIDTTPPTVTGVENLGEYKSATPTFNIEEIKKATLQKGAGEALDFTSGTPITADDTYVLVVTDKAGNTRTINFTIDNVEPKIEDVVDGTTYKQAVTPVNNAGDVETVVLTKDGKKVASYTTLGQITEDGVYKLTVADKAGNKTTVTFTIDTQVKGVTYITSNNNKPTQDPVLVTISAKEKLQPVSGWTLLPDALSMTKVYDNNATENVIVTDLIGNTETLNIVVTGIDKVAPEIVGTPTYTTTNPTNAPVTVTIVANEPIKPLNAETGWELADDQVTLTKTFANNKTEEVTFVDLAGNKIASPVSVVVDNIYATAPVIVGMYEQEEITIDRSSTGSVVLPTVTATDAKGANVAVNTTIQKVISEVDIEDVTEIDITSRGTYKITYTATDAAGNTKTVVRTIHVV